MNMKKIVLTVAAVMSMTMALQQVRTITTTQLQMLTHTSSM